MALAPSRDLSGEPSRSIMRRSMAAWSSASMPCSAGARTVFTFADCPKDAPARRSAAGRHRAVRRLRGFRWMRPKARWLRPWCRRPIRTSAHTVGLPRESRTSLAWMALNLHVHSGRRPRGCRRAAAGSGSRATARTRAAHLGVQIFDGRLAVDARQHQRRRDGPAWRCSQSASGGSRPRASRNSSGGGAVTLPSRRPDDRFQCEMVQQKPHIESRIAEVDDFEIDGHDALRRRPGSSWGSNRHGPC